MKHIFYKKNLLIFLTLKLLTLCKWSILYKVTVFTTLTISTMVNTFFHKTNCLVSGHYSIKEYHFHVYFHQHWEEEVDAALELKRKIVAEVAAGNMTVVCNGVTSDMIPGLDDSKVGGFYTEPIGPHAVGNFAIWTPREHLADMMSFMMLHRGDLVSNLPAKNKMR
jgi:aromatic ring-cleaving dioxygenase